MPDTPFVRLTDLAHRAGVKERTLRSWVGKWRAADRPDVVWKEGKDWVVAEEWADTLVRCGSRGPAAAAGTSGDRFQAGIDQLTLDEVAHWRGRALAAEEREGQAVAENNRLRTELAESDARHQATRAERDRLRKALQAFITDDVRD